MSNFRALVVFFLCLIPLLFQAQNERGELAKVNGEIITEADYQGVLEMYRTTGIEETQLKKNAWDQLLTNVLMRQHARTLGLDISDKELGDLLIGDEFMLSWVVRKQFWFPASNYSVDRSAIEQYWKIYESLKEKEALSPQEDEFVKAWAALLEAVMHEAYYAKSKTLLVQSIYTPNWMSNWEEEQYEELYTIDYVNFPFNKNWGNIAKPTATEIEAYYEEYKAYYTSEPTIGIATASFEISPSKIDSLELYKEMEDLAEEFEKTKEDTFFVDQNGGEFPSEFYMERTWEDEMVTKDLFQLKNGEVLGPYLSEGKYKVLKLLESKDMPMAVKSRHIRKGANMRNADELRTLYDELLSLKKQIEAGEATFEDLAKKYSDDKESRLKGGDLGYVRDHQVEGNFKSYLFDFGRKDSLSIVMGEYGLHLVQITDFVYPEKEAIEKGLRLAIIERPILASKSTIEQTKKEAEAFLKQLDHVDAFESEAKRQELLYSEEFGLLEADIELKFLNEGNNKSAIAKKIIKWGHEQPKSGVLMSEIFALEDYEGNTNRLVLIALIEKADKAIDNTVVQSEVERVVKRDKQRDWLLDQTKGLESLEEIADKFGLEKKTGLQLKYDPAFHIDLGLTTNLIAHARKMKTGALSKVILTNQTMVIIQLKAKEEWVPNSILGTIDKRSFRKQYELLHIATSEFVEYLKAKASIEDYRK